MIPTFETIADVDGDEGRRAFRTALAFLLAPGIAACSGPAWFMLWERHGPGNWDIIPVFVFFLAAVGYVTTLIVAVPIYLLLSEWARRQLWIVVPTAGAVAASPWVLLPMAADPTHPDVGTASFAFWLGCVAGVAFLLIRGAWHDVPQGRCSSSDR